jgi:predicted nucleic acid-binding protein
MIFVDTGAWIALTDESDQYNIEAIHIYKKLKDQNGKFLILNILIIRTRR